MRNLYFVFIAVAGWLPLTAFAAPPFMLGGIQINEPDQNTWCQTLVDNGFNTLQVTVYVRQGIWDSADLRVNPVDEGTVQKIRAAHSAGLKVALILRIDLDHSLPENRFLWHGLVLPSPDNLHPWFDRYAQFVRQWADIAEREGVALLGLGSEMNGVTATRLAHELPTLENYYLDEPTQAKRRLEILAAANTVPQELIRAPGDASPTDNLKVFSSAEDRALRDWAAAVTFAGEGRDLHERLKRINHRRGEMLSRWRAIIAEVRTRYTGRLTYAANFDSYQDVAFWPELDVMGINAYFPLRDPAVEASLQTLEAGWDGVFNQIEYNQSWMGVPKMPVVFTELGYTKRSGATTAPWAWQGFDLVGDSQTLMVWETRPLDPGERVRSMQALDRVNRKRGGLLTGLLYWKLTGQPHLAEIEAFALLLQNRPDHPDTDPLQDALINFTRATPPPWPKDGPARDDRPDPSAPAANASHP